MTRRSYRLNEYPDHLLALLSSVACLLQVYCLYSIQTGTLRVSGASVHALYVGVGVTVVLLVASLQTIIKRRKRP